MTAKSHTPPLDTRQFLKACNRVFGHSFMIKFFNVSERTYASWRSNRATANEKSIRTNYLEKHEMLLELLMEEPDGEELARGIVTKHANIVGCDLSENRPVEPDKATIEEECLDDYPIMVRLHTAIRDEEDMPVVDYLGSESRKEISETVEKYRQIKEKR
ncbi:MAG: hypothetical protein JEZ12_25510 [Desulfobacterium sp.]|nr:hypothetical protein [Desulfobacterium sp.]